MSTYSDPPSASALPSPLMRTEEVAALLAVRPSTIYSMKKRTSPSPGTTSQKPPQRLSQKWRSTT
jgi:predicted DNA-binding transcriptional regulator AlpA